MGNRRITSRGRSPTLFSRSSPGPRNRSILPTFFSGESFTFTVGCHELTGSKAPMKKPFLILKKVKRMDVDQSNQDNNAGTELEVVGIIRHWILFKTRPKALISIANRGYKVEVKLYYQYFQDERKNGDGKKYLIDHAAFSTKGSEGFLDTNF